MLAIRGYVVVPLFASTKKTTTNLNTTTMKETFKDIPGYEGMYQASDLGRIKSLVNAKEKILKPFLSNSGYLIVSLFKSEFNKKQTIHVLVMMAHNGFIPNKWKTVIDHKDDNKQNNKLSNLQEVTQRFNVTKNKKIKPLKIHDKRWRARIHINKKSIHLGYFKSEIDAANAYNKALKNHLLCV